MSKSSFNAHLTSIQLEVWDDENDDRRTKLTQAEFLASAWRLANDKARELRWIMQKNYP